MISVGRNQVKIWITFLMGSVLVEGKTCTKIPSIINAELKQRAINLYRSSYCSLEESKCLIVGHFKVAIKSYPLLNLCISFCMFK